MKGVRAFISGLTGCGLALLLALPGSAGAQDTGDQPLPAWYLGPLVGYMSPDSARDADQGINGAFILGISLVDSLYLEGQFFGTQLTRESDSDLEDYIFGGGLDLTLGTAAPGNPFFVIGGGAAQQDLASFKRTSGFGNLGLGVYLPFSFGGELWRLEGRYSVIFNDHPALAAEELLEDGRINLGVLFTYGEQAREAEEPAEVFAPPPPPITDSDGDGIADGVDKCPDTPRWVRPDANGCVPDTDGDGIDETKDCCPATPAGTNVDAAGCEPVPAPVAPTTTFTPPVDEDKDGVVDGQDACPHTVPRFDVDDRGCIKPETVRLSNVHFDLESSRLTADAYSLLRSVAASMKEQPGMKIEVGGHADATGGDKFNRDLSLERAQVVRDFLTYAGVPPQQLTVKGYGESAPLKDNVSPEGRAANRRVEFRRLDNQ
jgi:OmpA-OmpF porin, OOP family